MIYSLFQVAVATVALSSLPLIAALALADVGALTPALVVSIVSSVLALVLELVPGLSDKWHDLPQEVKRFAWILGCALVGILPWALGCFAARFGLDLTYMIIVGSCEPDTLAQGLQIAFAAYFSAQSVHGLSVATRKFLKVGIYADHV